MTENLAIGPPGEGRSRLKADMPAQLLAGTSTSLVENGQLDRAKAIAWGFIRSIDYWLWGLANGLTTPPMPARRHTDSRAEQPAAQSPVTSDRAEPGTLLGDLRYDKTSTVAV